MIIGNNVDIFWVINWYASFLGNLCGKPMAPDPLHSMYSALHKTKFKFIRIIIIIQSVLTYSSSEIRSHLSKHEAFLIKCAFCSGEYGILKKTLLR